MEQQILKRGPSPPPPPPRPPRPVSDLFSTPPTAEESERNPTRTIQYEYNHYINRRDVIDALSRGDLVIRSNDPNISCTRDNFYLSLLLGVGVGAEHMFHQCSIQQIEGGGAVNNAIHAYSKLIDKLIEEDKPLDVVNQVIDFLKIDYANAMNDHRTRSSYNQIKSRIFALFGENMLQYGHDSALFVSPQIFTELKTLLYHIFTNDQLYIHSIGIMKKLISKFVVHGDEHMVLAYRNASPLLKAHFFIYMLDNPEHHGEISAEMMGEIEHELVTEDSELNILLDTELYQTASDTVDVILQDIATRETRSFPEYSMMLKEFGGKKRMFRNIKSKSHSKKTKSKRNKVQKKKTRRSRRLVK
jgi:hypothetical protein